MNCPRRSRFAAIMSVPLLFLLVPFAAAAQRPSGDLSQLFDKREVMIAVRDGVKLHTEIYTPKSFTTALPIIFERTPYGISAPDKGYSPSLYRYSDMFAEGYIFVFQDIRGRYGSEGKFVMLRPIHDPSDPQGTDESSDAYDTIDWLVKNVPHNNGRVGMDGTSYDGFLVTMGMINPHPALKAASEQACMGDVFLGDDFFHNGAFRLSYGFEYTALLESSSENFSFQFDSFDLYDWYLRLGALSNVNKKYFHGKIPTWNEFVAHNSYDEFWKRHAVAYGLRDATVPNLNVAGFWDQEDFYGPVATYANLEKSDKKNLNYIVIGPWNHGGWGHGKGEALGAIPFGSDTSLYFRQKVEAPWFAYWLKDQGALPLKEALVFQSGSDTWTAFDSWPPRAAETQHLYFHENGRLDFTAPQSDSAEPFDSYQSDPAHPVPYRSRPIDMTYPQDHPGSWYTWLVQDQRFVDQRSDVATWQTADLTEDVTLAGQVTAKLFASTTGSDSDWIVKLIDVYPQKYPDNWKLSGYELMISDEIFRGRFRNSFAKPEAIKANEVTPYSIDLHTQNHVFRKGHRIMVQVQSSWFPVYDRNPQKFLPNIFEAKDEDYQKATQKIYRSKQFPSSVELSILPAGRTGLTN
ncbi:MAG TPA: CocE/NonD family hydrolase [Candidatus Saccharimonadales bacterium]|nr:CocE/NonD family hydrolase [Candidatus Saccharimonadales bacterium]